jgi:hypothetical protein
VNFDAQKFFIGLMNLFSTLLLGGLLTYLLMGSVGPVGLGDRYSKLAGGEAWAASLFASYLFGHLVFLRCSWLDEFYDWARRYTLNTQIATLARRGRLLPWLARAQIWLVFKAAPITHGALRRWAAFMGPRRARPHANLSPEYGQLVRCRDERSFQRRVVLSGVRRDRREACSLGWCPSEKRKSTAGGWNYGAVERRVLPKALVIKGGAYGKLRS